MKRIFLALLALLTLAVVTPTFARAVAGVDDGSGSSAQRPIPVMVLVEHGEFEDKATQDLENLAKKFRERLAKGKVKLATLVTDRPQATVIVQFLSKQWQPTGSSTTTAGAYFGGLKTTQDTAYGVYGVLLSGESEMPFNLRLSSQQIFNKDGTLSGMVDKHVEDFIKRNYDKLLTLTK